MIRVFGKTDKNFLSNGDVVLSPLKASVHKQDNGDYYLDLETDLKYADYLESGNLVVANTPQGDQAFRISNPSKTGKKIRIKAWHVFYDSKNYLVYDTNVVNKTGNQAINQINNATNPVSEFVVDSNITTRGSFRPVRESLYKSIELMMDVYGGHLIRDNYHVSLKKNIGVDNGVVIQYRKNLKELTCEESWDNVVTDLLPTGKDGIMLNFVDQSADKYLHSDIRYDIPYTKTVAFSQDLDKDDYPSESAYNLALVNDLRDQAQDYLDKNCVPQVNYTLKAHLDTITDIGDIIEVKDERLGIDLITSVIAFEYDCIFEKYTQIEFGNFKPNLANLVPNITQTVDKSVFIQISNQFGSIPNRDIDDIVS